jgi:hypothetical protein
VLSAHLTVASRTQTKRSGELLAAGNGAPPHHFFSGRLLSLSLLSNLGWPDSIQRSKIACTPSSDLFAKEPIQFRVIQPVVHIALPEYVFLFRKRSFFLVDSEYVFSFRKHKIPILDSKYVFFFWKRSFFG